MSSSSRRKKQRPRTSSICNEEIVPHVALGYGGTKLGWFRGTDPFNLKNVSLQKIDIYNIKKLGIHPIVAMGGRRQPLGVADPPYKRGIKTGGIPKTI